MHRLHVVASLVRGKAILRPTWLAMPERKRFVTSAHLFGAGVGKQEAVEMLKAQFMSLGDDERFSAEPGMMWADITDDHVVAVVFPVLMKNSIFVVGADVIPHVGMVDYQVPPGGVYPDQARAPKHQVLVVGETILDVRDEAWRQIEGYLLQATPAVGAGQRSGA